MDDMDQSTTKMDDYGPITNVKRQFSHYDSPLNYLPDLSDV